MAKKAEIKATFSDEELCKAWQKASPEGTRQDVVTALMKLHKDDDTEETRSIYIKRLNSRHAQLRKIGLIFPPIKSGSRGRTGESREDKLAKLNAIFGK